MLLEIPALLSAEEVAGVHNALMQAKWGDGKVTAGYESARVKDNLQLPEDDPTRRKPDITLAQKHLKWEPKVPLKEGLEKTIDWFRGINVSDYRPPTPNF